MENEDSKNEIAGNYYRLRVQKIEEERPIDFEWRTDVLYTPPKAYPSKRKMMYLMQLIGKDIKTYDIALVDNKVEAKKRYEKVKRELETLSNNEFEEKYGISAKELGGKRENEEKDTTDERKDEKRILEEAILFAGEIRVEKRTDEIRKENKEKGE